MSTNLKIESAPHCKMDAEYATADCDDLEYIALVEKWAIVAAINLSRSVGCAQVANSCVIQVALDFGVSLRSVSRIVNAYDQQVMAGVKVPDLHYERCVFLRLPAELICAIAGKWLCLHEIANLDSALCNVKLRALILPMLQSPLCVVVEHPRSYGHIAFNKGLQWCVMKKIRMEDVVLFRDCNITTWKVYLNLFGTYVTSAAIESSSLLDGQSDNPPKLVAQYCPNLTSLVWSCCDIKYGLIDVLINCRQLASITMYANAADTASFEEVAATHHLPLTSLDMRYSDVNEEAILKFCAPAYLQKLRLSTLRARDWSQFVNLRSLAVPSQLSYEHGPLFLHILQCCPLIANLDVSGSQMLTDQIVHSMCCALRHLRTLSIQFSEDVTDDCLRSIAQYHKHTLEALYIMECENISAHGINHILLECAQLRTLSCTPLSTVSISLMGNITTLIMDRTFELCNGQDDSFVWQEICLHCRNLQRLNVIFEYGNFESDRGEAIHIACTLPKFRSLYMQNVEETEAEEVITEICIRRPEVCVAAGHDSWYKLFEMPV